MEMTGSRSESFGYKKNDDTNGGSSSAKEKKTAVKIPGRVEKFFIDTAGMTKYSLRFMGQVFRPPYDFAEISRQCYEIGNKSFPLVAITGFIMGLVLTVQSRPTLAEFGAESWLPGMVGISIVREMGPVITSLICAGKIGSGIGAELASMKVTEQIDAMEVSGTNPFKFLVISRILACTIMIPLLVVLGDAISLVGSYAGVNIRGSVSAVLFFSQVFDALSFSDLFPALIKTVFFGFAIGLVGCYKGYNADEGTAGVGKASNSAVVVASLAVFIIDMIAVQLTDIFVK
jgi:phospholipid/cholesterol/gamma-HCH transport system permease protein